MRRLPSVLLLSIVATPFIACRRMAPEEMTFFVTSVQAHDGGNLGGLSGADRHCQRLAEAVGSRHRTWRAYLSASGDAGGAPVHARDRIGRGPWVNVRGTTIAANLEALHGAGNALGRRTAITERGDPTPHDIMTGSRADGTLAAGDATCHDWTSTQGHAVVGHSNKEGGCCGDAARSWNSAHVSEGCTLPALQAMGGAALFYCFAAN
jgi:hypothetical protein